MASQRFIDECKLNAYANRNGRIYVDGITNPITNSDYLQDITIDNDCNTTGNIVGSTYSKKALINIIDQNLTDKLIDKIIHVEFGVKYADNSMEYLSLGKYTIERPKNEQTAKLTQFTAYDDFKKLDTPYKCNLIFENNVVTIADFYRDVCNQLGLVPKTTEFINSHLVIPGNPFHNRETLRTVLSNIEAVACSYSEIDYDDNSIDLVWLSQSVDPDYVFQTGDYTTLKGGIIKYGPVNTLVIKDSQIDGENVSISDSESITEYGETEFCISDNYFLYTQELRTQALNGIWERIQGLTYYDYELETSYGKPFLKCGSKIGIHTNEGDYFESYVLKHAFKYNGTFHSAISAKALTKEETLRKNNVETLKDAFRRTERITDKINGEIKDIIEEQTEQQVILNQTIKNVNDIQTLFQITGGNNLIKNSVGLFNDVNKLSSWDVTENADVQYGEDNELIGITVSSSKISISNTRIQTSDDNIINITLDSIKSLSYKVRQDADTTSTISVYGLNSDRPLYQKTFEGEMDWREIYDDTESKFFADYSKLKIVIESHSLYDGRFEISDLILNNGEKQSWTPATGEIWGRVVKMNQDGVSVYGLEGGVATLMASQGFHIRALYGNELGEIITQLNKSGLITTNVELSGRLTQKNLVRDIIHFNGYETYIDYIKGGGY